ncbi:MAG: hypothetical protein QNJ46_12420 [Leptolyngbyaceae cyanobacterium MO_188.B28]|nr:hypothetical protein [Leptolyngbyaceae cyanobacterium MO_188.B28]
MSKSSFINKTPNARPGVNLGPSETEAYSKSDTKFISAADKERAQNHYNRALERMQLRNSSLAVQDLRDAIKQDPYNSQYHAMLGKIHLEKGLTGMANINLRRALKLNPEDALALKCLKKLKAQSQHPSTVEAPSLVNRLKSFLGSAK